MGCDRLRRRNEGAPPSPPSTPPSPATAFRACEVRRNLAKKPSLPDAVGGASMSAIPADAMGPRLRLDRRAELRCLAKKPSPPDTAPSRAPGPSPATDRRWFLRPGPADSCMLTRGLPDALARLLGPTLRRGSLRGE